MNLLVGDNDLTADKDYKHVVKRLRNLLLRKMGSMVNGFHITPALLRFHLKANGVSSLRLNYLLNPSDRQNVPLCYTLLKEVWSLPDPTPSDTPSFIAARKALQLLGSLFRHIVIPFIQINLSLHEQLSHLSAAAHLATFLYAGIEPGSGSGGPRSVLSIGDPVATALKCEGNVFLAIVQINDILIDNESVLEIAPAFLMEPVVTVQFQTLQLVEIVDHVNDVDRTDADWKWNRKMERPILKTRGSCIQVIDPDVSSRVPLEPVYLFRSDELRALAALVIDSITDEERLRLPSVKRSDFFPYRSHGAFVCSTILFLFKI